MLLPPLPPEDAKLVTVSPMLLLLLLLLLFACVAEVEDEDEEMGVTDEDEDDVDDDDEVLVTGDVGKEEEEKSSSAHSLVHESPAASNALRLAALSGEGGGDLENEADAVSTSPLINKEEVVVEEEDAGEELEEEEETVEVGEEDNAVEDGDEDNAVVDDAVLSDLTLNPLATMSLGMNVCCCDCCDCCCCCCIKSSCLSVVSSSASSIEKKPRPTADGERDDDGERGLWLRHGAPSMADMQNIRFMYLRSVGDANGLRRSRSIVIAYTSV